MSERKSARLLIAVSGFLFLLAIPAIAETQSTPLSPTQRPQMLPHASRPKAAARSVDYLQGLTLTEDQKAKIDQIHQDMKSRMDIVAKDPAEDGTAKGAMLEGLARMERRQVFLVLTPEQQAEVRKKVMAGRVAEQEKNKTALPPR